MVMRRIIFYITFFLLTAWAFSCSKNKSIQITATVRNLTGQLDGCGMLIQLDNGQLLEPVKLPAGLTLVDGRRAEIRYKPFSQASICMVGPTIEITSLRYL